MKRSVPAFLLLVAAFALAAWLGWGSVPMVAALWGLLRPAVRRPLLSAAAAGLLGWVVWLGIDFVVAPQPFLRIGSQAAAILQLPAPLFVLLTLLFPFLLAWSSAALAYELSGVLRRGASDATLSVTSNPR